MALLVTSQGLRVKLSWLFLGTLCILTTTSPLLWGGLQKQMATSIFFSKYSPPVPIQ